MKSIVPERLLIYFHFSRAYWAGRKYYVLLCHSNHEKKTEAGSYIVMYANIAPFLASSQYYRILGPLRSFFKSYDAHRITNGVRSNANTG